MKSSSCRHAKYEFNNQSFSPFWRCWVNFSSWSCLYDNQSPSLNYLHAHPGCPPLCSKRSSWPLGNYKGLRSPVSGITVKVLNMKTNDALSTQSFRKLEVLEALHQEPRADIFHYITRPDTGELLAFLKLCKRERRCQYNF